MDLMLDDATLTQLLTGAPSPKGFHWEASTYVLHDSDGNAFPSAAAPPEAHAHLSVSMDRTPLASSEAHTWAWHKNCVLPPLKVTCAAEGLPLENLSCLLSAVRVEVSSHAAHDVGLDGDTLRPLVHGACSFSSLSFKTTSYNLKGKPLHLMATLLVRSGDGGQLCAVCHLISPPIIVNARKRAPKERASAKPTAAGDPTGTASEGGLLPFAPDLLERKMEKVEKVQESASRRQIDNSMEGLRAYLSALNIRNKCKHPLFLVLRFDACVSLLYDESRADSPLTDDAAFYRMMEALACTDPLSAKASAAATGSTGELPPFVVAVAATHDETSCSKANCPVHGLPIQLTSLFSLPHASTLPATFKPLCELQISELRRTYCRLYCTHTGRTKGPLIAPPAPSKQLATVCNACDVPHVPVPAAPYSPQAAAQRHAVALMASLHQVAAGTEELDDCPEQEWEHKLLVLAEAMAQHCHTRSAAEIVAFMKGEEASATKRMSSGMAPSSGMASASGSPRTEFTAENMQQFTPESIQHDLSMQHDHAHESVGCSGCDLGWLDYNPSEWASVGSANVHDHCL